MCIICINGKQSNWVKESARTSCSKAVGLLDSPAILPQYAVDHVKLNL